MVSTQVAGDPLPLHIVGVNRILVEALNNVVNTRCRHPVTSVCIWCATDDEPYLIPRAPSPDVRDAHKLQLTEERAAALFRPVSSNTASCPCPEPHVFRTVPQEKFVCW